MISIERIKKDLRELKKTTHLVEALIGAKKNYLKRIRELKGLHRIQKREKLETLERLYEAVEVEPYIIKIEEYIEGYHEAIESLGITDRAVVIDYFVNGIPAWKIGARLGYSEDGIRKRLKGCIIKIADFLNKK